MVSFRPPEGVLLGQISRPIAAAAMSAALLCSIGVGAAIGSPPHAPQEHLVAAASSVLPLTAPAPYKPAHASSTVFGPSDTIVVAPPTPPPPPPPPVKVTHEQLPLGKGMFIYEPERTEFGNVDVIVGRALDVGLST